MSFLVSFLVLTVGILSLFVIANLDVGIIYHTAENYTSSLCFCLIPLFLNPDSRILTTARCIHGMAFRFSVQISFRI